MAGTAAKLIAMYACATPDYVNSTVLTIPGHLGHALYNLFTVSVSSTTSVSLFSVAHNDAHEIDVLYSPATL